MSDVFAGIKHLLKTDSTSIDNKFFKLHYKATMFILVACSILLTQKHYFSDPIDCFDAGGVSNDILDPYCWIHDTYTVPSLKDKIVGREVVAPGVGPAKEDEEVTYHSYYQWVTLFVYFQAILFYIPRYLWKVFEGGKIKMLVAQLNTPIVDEEVKKSRVEMMVKYFSINLNTHNQYAIKFIICEALNFVNVVGQIYFTDRFLGYEFSDYGTDVLAMSERQIGTRHDPMNRVFPKVTGCTYNQWGSDGGWEHHTALCVMPLNVLNEKIFIFLWFWYIIVAVLTAVGLMYRIATFIPGVRTMMLRARARLAPAVAVEQVAGKCQYGDWFMLIQLGKNMDPLIFKDFILDLGKKFKGVDD